MSWFLWGMVAGALATNVRYFFLYRKFQAKHYVLDKKHNTYKHLLARHFRGATDKGEVFVYCPFGRIVSWSAGDYDHQWCHFCQEYFSAHVRGLLDPEERREVMDREP